MSAPIVYDKAKWHYEGDFPEDLEEEQAFVHSGMYLGWLIDNDLISEEFSEDNATEIAEFKKRKMSPIDIFERCDGCLVDDMLNDLGNRFSQAYFEFEVGEYLSDYEKLLGKKLPSLYHVKFQWKSFDKISAQITKRFKEWKKKNILT